MLPAARYWVSPTSHVSHICIVCQLRAQPYVTQTYPRHAVPSSDDAGSLRIRHTNDTKTRHGFHPLVRRRATTARSPADADSTDDFVDSPFLGFGPQATLTHPQTKPREPFSPSHKKSTRSLVHRITGPKLFSGTPARKHESGSLEFSPAGQSSEPGDPDPPKKRLGRKERKLMEPQHTGPPTLARKDEEPAELNQPGDSTAPDTASTLQLNDWFGSFLEQLKDEKKPQEGARPSTTNTKDQHKPESKKDSDESVASWSLTRDDADRGSSKDAAAAIGDVERASGEDSRKSDTSSLTAASVGPATKDMQLKTQLSRKERRKASRAARARNAASQRDKARTKTSVAPEVPQIVRKLGSRAAYSKGDGADSKPNHDDDAEVSQTNNGKTTDSSALTLVPRDLAFESLHVEQPPVPKLAHNLDRVLFNRGVYTLQDRHSGVYNFDPYLENIMSVNDFDFDALRKYKTSSQDPQLAAVASEHDIKYLGSTSSMTSMLTQFHYLLSGWRELNFDSLSRGFAISDSKTAKNFTEVYRAPTAIFLRYKGVSTNAPSADSAHSRKGLYAIDADKEYSTPNILMALGHSLEKLLTHNPSSFERYRKSDPRQISASERDAPEAYHYSKQGDILMRSQLDAEDKRLPGSGVFDLKTRAVLPIRMSSRDHEGMTGYQILSEHGRYESYERELHDMYRSTFLKYSLQVRMGRMEGIFIAYHNVLELFGFQFMNLSDMDEVLHGQRDTCLGDQEFKASLAMVQNILDEATTEYPQKSIRLHFETRGGVEPFMYVFAEPCEEQEVERIQGASDKVIKEYETSLRGVGEPRAAANTVPDGASSQAPADPDEVDPSTSNTNTSTQTHTSDTESDGTCSSTTPPSDQPTTSASSTTATDTHKPLLAWTLRTSSKVNKVPVQRPTELRPSDTWQITYDLKRVPDPSRAWSLYEATKARRAKILSFDDGRDEVGATGHQDGKDGGEMQGKSLYEAMMGPAEASEPAVPRKKGVSESYLSLLRGMSERGRVIRDERMRKAEGKEKMVVGREATTVARSVLVDQTGGESVQHFDDYLDWMWSGK